MRHHHLYLIKAPFSLSAIFHKFLFWNTIKRMKPSRFTLYTSFFNSSLQMKVSGVFYFSYTPILYPAIDWFVIGFYLTLLTYVYLCICIFNFDYPNSEIARILLKRLHTFYCDDFIGNLTSTVVPWFSLLFTIMLPLCCRTIL